jgi:dihydrofolate reductase
MLGSRLVNEEQGEGGREPVIPKECEDMSVVIVMSISLDGYVAGSNDTPEQPLGDGGDGLHAWMSAGGPDGRARLDELRESTGAMISGRRTYDIVDGWSGSHPFGGIPLFVVSHSVPDEVPIGATPFTFVPDGVASAVEQARRAAGEKDVYVIGGASVDQQLLDAGLVDELRISIVPVLLGGGVRLFERMRTGGFALEQLAISGSRQVMHIRYRVSR